MRLKTILLLFILLSGAANAQNKVEELLASLKTAKTDSARGALCHKLSIKYYAKDNLKSKEYAEKSNAYFIKADNKSGQGLALQMKGFILMGMGENIEGLEAQKESIRLLEESGNYKASVISYSGASYCLEKEGRIDEALKFVIRSLEVIEEHNLPDAQKAKNLTDLGRVYRESNQLQKSIEVYNEALEISQREEDHSTAGVLLMNIGNVYLQKEEYEKALTYYKKSLKETEYCNCAGRRSQVWSNIGFGQYYLKNADGVMAAADSAQRNLLDNTDLDAETDIELLKGMAHQLKKEHTPAIKYLEKAFALAQKNNFKEKMVRISSTLGKSYAATGNSEKLEELLLLSLAAKDSSYNQEMVKSIAEMEIRYETELKEQKLQEAAAQNQLKEKYIADVTVRNRWLIVLVVFGLLLAITSFWLMQKSRKTAKELGVKNSELATLLEQKKLLLKEIHHRVKNNLQTVSSLLNLQTRASESDVVKKAMVEGQTRLKSISLLHQKLYQHEELTKIEMDDYISDLAEYIIKNFNTLNKQISLKTNANNIALDLDTAIPLGLILNELITNSIKYSFRDTETGEIEVNIEQQEGKNKYQLTVSDNGAGLPQNLEIETLPSMGLKLVKSLSRQIHGSFETMVDATKAHFVVKFTETIQ